MTNRCTRTRLVVPPTIGCEPLVAYALEMRGHTSFMVRIIGVYARRDLNPRCHHWFLMTVEIQSPNAEVELMRHHP